MDDECGDIDPAQQEYFSCLVIMAVVAVVQWASKREEVNEQSMEGNVGPQNFLNFPSRVLQKRTQNI